MPIVAVGVVGRVSAEDDVGHCGRAAVVVHSAAVPVLQRRGIACRDCETVQRDVCNAGCVEHVIAIVARVAERADVPAEGRYVRCPVTLFAKGLCAGKAAEDIDARLQVERNRAIRVIGRIVRPLGHPDFVARVGHK